MPGFAVVAILLTMADRLAEVDAIGGAHKVLAVYRHGTHNVFTDHRYFDSREVSEQVIGEAELVVTELVTNSLRHASPLGDRTVRIHWKARGDNVEVEVSDGGAETEPAPAPRQMWATSGRGLRIVRSIAHEWGVLDDPHGRIVWACVGGPSRRRVTT